MKFNFFGKNKNSQTSRDCACGCTKEARNSVRLTDAEIAADILSDLDCLVSEYKCLCESGCDCGEKLRSCENSRNCICEFVEK